MRTIKQISKMEQEFCDKVWYNRHLLLKDRISGGVDKCDPKIWEGALKAAKEVEKKYGIKNLIYDDFEWGMINGKLSTLRWVLGEDRDILDT